MAEKKATDPDLEINERNVVKQLTDNGFSAKDWKHLGLSLKVPSPKLDEIDANNKFVKNCLIDVISHWIRNGEVSWKTLWEAVFEINDYNNAGCAIRDWFNAKTWSDKREFVRRIYIQLIKLDRSVQATFDHDEVSTDGKDNFFRVQPMPDLSRYPPNESMFERHFSDMKSNLSTYLKVVESESERYKAGYEARFGHIYFKLTEGDKKEAEASYFNRKYRCFSTQVEDSIEAVISEKCVGKPLVKWLVDPLKFVVEEPAHKDLVYVAVVSRSNDGYFVLHEVYQQSRQKKATFDIAQPRRKYDIRIADCCALRCQTDDPVVVKIARDIVKSIKSDGDPEVGKLSMQLFDTNWHVEFFRHKKQLKHHLKDDPTWRLAEFDVAEFEWTEDLRKTVEHGVSIPVTFPSKTKKEIELWSRKQFPSDYDRSFVSTEENEDDMKTGHVSVKSWKTEDLLRDFDKFVQAAFDITKILQK